MRSSRKCRKDGLDQSALDRARVKMRSDLYANLEQFVGFGRANLLASFALFDDDPSKINQLEDGFDKGDAGAGAEDRRGVFAARQPDRLRDYTGQDWRARAEGGAMKSFMFVALAALAGMQRPRRRNLLQPARPKTSRFPPRAGSRSPMACPVTMVPFGQVPKAAIRLVVAAGNVYEDKDEIWLADTTGNLMREGTTTESADAVARCVREHGRRAGDLGRAGYDVGFDRSALRTRGRRGPQARRRRSASEAA